MTVKQALHGPCMVCIHYSLCLCALIGCSVFGCVFRVGFFGCACLGVFPGGFSGVLFGGVFPGGLSGWSYPGGLLGALSGWTIRVDDPGGRMGHLNRGGVEAS